MSANLGFFVYSAIFGPSNRAAVIDASFGSNGISESYRDSPRESSARSVVLNRFLSDVFVKLKDIVFASEFGDLWSPDFAWGTLFSLKSSSEPLSSFKLIHFQPAKVLYGQLKVLAKSYPTRMGK